MDSAHGKFECMYSVLAFSSRFFLMHPQFVTSVIDVTARLETVPVPCRRWILPQHCWLMPVGSRWTCVRSPTRQPVFARRRKD